MYIFIFTGYDILQTQNGNNLAIGCGRISINIFTGMQPSLIIFIAIVLYMYNYSICITAGIIWIFHSYSYAIFYYHWFIYFTLGNVNEWFKIWPGIDSEINNIYRERCNTENLTPFFTDSHKSNHQHTIVRGKRTKRRQHWGAGLSQFLPWLWILLWSYSIPTILYLIV